MRGGNGAPTATRPGAGFCEKGAGMDYAKAARYWTDREADSKRMGREELLAEAEAFIAARKTCALATADLEGNVRCTPIEYSYLDGAFWMFSEGGLKFRGLAENKQVCLAIYDPYEGFGALCGMQVTGTAEVVEPWSEDYLKLLSHKGIPEEALRKMPTEMHLIKVRPTEIDLLCSALKERGYDSRQHLELED